MKKLFFSFCLLFVSVFHQMEAASLTVNSFDELVREIESSGIEVLSCKLAEESKTIVSSSSSHRRNCNKNYPLFVLESESEKEKENEDDELTSSEEYSKSCRAFTIIYFLSENNHFCEEGQTEFLAFDQELKRSLESTLYLEFQVFRI